MNGWMDGWVDRRKLDGWVGECKVEWNGGMTLGCMDGWREDGLMDTN